MDAVIPWSTLLALIEPHYRKAGRGRQPVGLEKVLRIYFLQQWFNLSDPQAEDAIYDSESMRRFVGVELGDDVLPDETTILRFRHLLERQQLTEAIFGAVQDLLTERRLLLTSDEAARRDGPPRPRALRGGDARRHGRHHAGRRPAARRGTRRLRRLGLLERSPAPRLSGERDPLSRQSPRASSPAPDRAPAANQPRPVAASCAWQACVSRGQAALGLRESALPRLGEERRARLHGVRTGQSLPGAAPLDTRQGRRVSRDPRPQPRGAAAGTDRPTGGRARRFPDVGVMMRRSTAVQIRTCAELP